MSDDIINQNADKQEVEVTPTATTNEPVKANTNVPLEGTEESSETSQAENASEEPKTEEPAIEVPKTNGKYVQPVQTAHDDFDWSVDKRNVTAYSKEEKEKYDHVYENTFKQINDGEMINGIVVGLTKTDVVINIGFKSDGLVSLNEFRDMQHLKVGDEVEVMVAEKEDRDGNLHLSRKQARTTRAWEKIVEMHKSGEIVTGLVTSKTKGGLIVDVFGMETFLPGSQIDVKPVTDYDQFVGKTMEFKVVKINEAIKNAVVSHKALIESDIEQQRAEIMGKLEKGQVLEGTIKNITDFGAFLDLGGLDGLLYITDISWGRINHPTEVLKLDQKLNVVVLDFDDDKKRISLGLKQLTPHPWDTLPETIKEGEVIKGKVVNIEDYGAFLEIMPGVEGLVHVSEITWANTPINAKEFFKLGDEHEAKVVTLSKEDRKMSLSIKQMTQDPWNTIEIQYPEGSKHKGLVKNITPYGVFVELSPGIGGMIHISDLSWLKRFNNPNEYTKVGHDIDVVIMSIDKDNRKLQLGHKQIEEDPWNSLEETFPVGSIHQGTVTRKDDKGAIVQLPYGLEGFAPARHLLKEDEKSIGLDEIAEFMVIEFDRNDKKIVLSHTRIWQQAKAEEKEAFVKEKRAEGDATKKAVKSIQAKVEKTTLGDLSVLADLKKKMDTEASNQDTKIEAKVEPKVEAKTEPKVETKVEPTIEAKEEPKVEAIAEPKAEAIAEPKVEAKAEPKVEAIAEPNAEAIAEPKVEAKAEPKVETIAEPKVEDIAEPKVETIAEPKVEAIAEPKVETIAEPKVEAIAKPKAKTKDEPNVEPDSESNSEEKGE